MPDLAPLDRDTAAVFSKGDYPAEPAAPAADAPASDAPAVEATPDRPATASVEAPKATVAPSTPPDGYVPHGALHEERERRKRLQAQHDELATRYATIEKRMQEWEARNKPQPPDLASDPVGHLNHKLTEVQGALEKQQQESAADKEARQQRENWAQFQQVYGQAAATFAKGSPDFNDAYNFLNKQKTEELQEAGYTESEIQGILHKQEVEFVVKAFKDGVNPAERIYNVAKRRGYAKKAADQQVDAAKKLDTIAAGQSKAPEFSASGSGKPKLTVEAVAAMSDDEFAKVAGGDGWEKLVREISA